jgi:hypothetical protein
MEQKLVQRGETEIVADACNASYLNEFKIDQTKYNVGHADDDK